MGDWFYLWWIVRELLIYVCLEFASVVVEVLEMTSTMKVVMDVGDNGTWDISHDELDGVFKASSDGNDIDRRVEANGIGNIRRSGKAKINLRDTIP